MKLTIQFAALALLLTLGAACGELVEEYSEPDETSAAATSAAATEDAVTNTPAATTTAASTPRPVATPPPPPPTIAPVLPSPTQPATAETSAPEATATVPPPLPTIVFSPGDRLTREDLTRRGTAPSPQGEWLGTHIHLWSVDVRVPIDARPGSPGRIGQAPASPQNAVWWDFAAHPGLGGLPGVGGNVVIAGYYFDVDGQPAAFRRLGDLVPGDLISIELSDGRVIGYEVEFNKLADPAEIDWNAVYASTPIESVTLISAADESARAQLRIVWGRIPFYTVPVR